MQCQFLNMDTDTKDWEKLQTNKKEMYPSTIANQAHRSSNLWKTIIAILYLK